MSSLVAAIRPLAYISLPILLLRSIAASSPIARYYVRQGVYLALMFTLSACNVFLAASLFIIGRRYDTNHVVGKIFYPLVSYALDLSVHLEGEEHLANRPGILMMNHQSMLDLFVVARVIQPRTSIMSKESLRYSPMGPFMMMTGAIFVDRRNNARAVRSLQAAGETMRNLRLSLFMFPEGTRASKEIPDMLPLKKGGFHLAVQAGLPIIPIVTENYWRLFHKGLFLPGTIKVRVLPPIQTAGLTASDIPWLVTKVRDQMLKTIREISVAPASSARIEKAERKLRSVPPPPPPVAKVETSNEAAPQRAAGQLGGGASTASLGSSFSASTFPESERGAETEEEEGIVMVGRPE